MIKLSCLAIALLVFLSFASPANACSCIDARDIYDTPRKLYDFAPIIAVVKLESLQKRTDNGKFYKVDGYGSFTMIVQKAYKGDIKNGESLVFDQGGGGDCLWFFKPENMGSEFLIYFGPKSTASGLWEIHICSGSIDLSDAKKDIEFLDAYTSKPRRKEKKKTKPQITR